LMSRGGGGDGERQPDVPETEDRDTGHMVSNVRV
jgi:hypothetical protein